MEKAPFYAEGLRFSCKRCSSCCRYDPGFVFLSENDLNKLAKAVEMDKNSFFKTYCRWVIDWKGDEVLSLKEKSNKDCIFWNEGCTVYAARPQQCITFPFWEAIVFSKQSWEINAASCPGMNSGCLHSHKEIEQTLGMRIQEPILTKQGVSL